MNTIIRNKSSIITRYDTAEVLEFNSVIIGKQEWMAENLDISFFQNGDQIFEGNSDIEWKLSMDLHQQAWCYYNNDLNNSKKFGKLYNWYAVDDLRGLAPKGWHVPTKEEFEILAMTVNDDGNALKAEGQGNGEGLGTNTSGFSAILSGDRYVDGAFYSLGQGTVLWSSTEQDARYAFAIFLPGGYNKIERLGNPKISGFSVRCIKD